MLPHSLLCQFLGFGNLVGSHAFFDLLSPFTSLLLIPTETTSQLIDIIGMRSYNNNRGVNNDQILPLDISSSSSGNSEV